MRMGCTPRNKSFSFFSLAGDVNRDRIVDSQDYTIVVNDLNTSGGWAAGDLNADGVVNAADLQIVQTNLGQMLRPCRVPQMRRLIHCQRATL